MLKFLHIENIAVIEESDIEFERGLNVLTGETGAGKSIIIDSINAVLGERTSKDLIRSGCDEALVSALFGDFNPQTLKFLKENDIDADQDGNVLITRRLSLKGKGIIKINGKPFTASALKEISSSLINIHGQHDSQALLNPDRHCDFIDAVAQNDSLKSEYYTEFKDLNKIRKELNALVTDEDEKARKTDLLKYQINEIDSAGITVGEIQKLKARLKVAEEFEKNLKGFSAVGHLLSGNDDENGIITNLKIASKLLSTLENDTAKDNFSKLNEIIAEAQGVLSAVNGFCDSLEGDGYNTDEINERLDFLYKLMVKYGNSEEEILEFSRKAKAELEAITFFDKRGEELENELAKAKERLINAGERLTNSRKAAAESFSRSVCEVLFYLNMPNVKFVTEIESGRYTSNGCDCVEFKISANQGEEIKPLHKIASGGELSRVMLAIKSVLSGRDLVETMIFDEIDSGLSGFAADKVGVQLKKVSKEKQVICITHLAQIAALGDNHLLIEKAEQKGRTKTRVSSLNRENRIKEIARIMSGQEITENIYNSAKELLDRSKS